MKCICSAKDLSLTIKAPIITSECPPRYLVAECITISAPNSKGSCKYGVAKVLSTATKIALLFCLTILEIASISAIFIKGLVGVSNQINLVLSFKYVVIFSGFSVFIK